MIGTITKDSLKFYQDGKIKINGKTLVNISYEINENTNDVLIFNEKTRNSKNILSKINIDAISSELSTAPTRNVNIQMRQVIFDRLGYFER